LEKEWHYFPWNVCKPYCWKNNALIDPEILMKSPFAQSLKYNFPISECENWTNYIIWASGKKIGLGSDSFKMNRFNIFQTLSFLAIQNQSWTVHLFNFKFNLHFWIIVIKFYVVMLKMNEHHSKSEWNKKFFDFFRITKCFIWSYWNENGNFKRGLF
jgi:hypothetical protein